VHRPAFTVTFVAASDGVDGIRSFRALLKIALRRFGLRAIDVRECALPAHQDERARLSSQSRSTKETPMSAFSERVRSQRTGFYRATDLERDTEITHTIDHLDEGIVMFGKKMDVLNFSDTGRQLQLNLTTAEFLLNAFGDDPESWKGKQVTLFLAEFTYENEVKLGIRLKRPGALGATPPAPARKPPLSNAPARSAAPSAGNGGEKPLDDEIPF
jgi:hypothetical protein